MPGSRLGLPAGFSRGFDPGSPANLRAKLFGGLIVDFLKIQALKIQAWKLVCD